MHVADDGATDEDILDRAQVWVLELLNDGDVVKLDVEELIDALECAAYRDVVLELDRDFVVNERLEEAEEQHDRGGAGGMLGAAIGEQTSQCCTVATYVRPSSSRPALFSPVPAASPAASTRPQRTTPTAFASRQRCTPQYLLHHRQRKSDGRAKASANRLSCRGCRAFAGTYSRRATQPSPRSSSGVSAGRLVAYQHDHAAFLYGSYGSRQSAERRFALNIFHRG